MAEKTVMYYMYEDEVSAKITVENGQVSVENYTDDLVKKPFGVFDQPSYKQFQNFLEKRCFPRSRYNCRQLLDDAGLDYYDPYRIVKLTHGAMCDDVFWIRWEGEKISWQDVNPRRK